MIALELFLEKENIPLDIRTPSLQTPLWIAAANHHWDCYLGFLQSFSLSLSTFPPTFFSPPISHFRSFLSSYYLCKTELLHRGANQYIGTNDGSLCADFFLSLSSKKRRSCTKNKEKEKILESLPWSGSPILKKIWRLIKKDDSHLLQFLKSDKTLTSIVRNREISHIKFALTICSCRGKLSLLHSLLTDPLFSHLEEEIESNSKNIEMLLVSLVLSVVFRHEEEK